MAEQFRACLALSETRNLGPRAQIQVDYTSSDFSSRAADPLFWPLRASPKESHTFFFQGKAVRVGKGWQTQEASSLRASERTDTDHSSTQQKVEEARTDLLLELSWAARG